jgi:hypothetical protein
MPEKNRSEFRNSVRLDAASFMSHTRGQPRRHLDQTAEGNVFEFLTQIINQLTD